MLSKIMFSLFLREVYWFFTYHRIIYLAQYTNYICFQFHKNHCTESSPHIYWIKKHIIILWLLYSYDNFNKYLIIAQFIPVKKYKIVCVLWCTTSLYWLWFWSTSHVYTCMACTLHVILICPPMLLKDLSTLFIYVSNLSYHIIGFFFLLSMPCSTNINYILFIVKHCWTYFLFLNGLVVVSVNLFFYQQIIN